MTTSNPPTPTGATARPVLPRLVVDDCPSAEGHWTIRPDNGTPNGDTSVQPIATVYDGLQRGGPHKDGAQRASLIVRAVNAHDELVAALRECVDMWGGERPETPYGNAGIKVRTLDAARALLARIDAAKGGE